MFGARPTGANAPASGGGRAPALRLTRHVPLLLASVAPRPAPVAASRVVVAPGPVAVAPSRAVIAPSWAGVALEPARAMRRMVPRAAEAELHQAVRRGHAVCHQR